jgi:hypothetical protein
MTFGEHFSKFLTDADWVALLHILKTTYDVQVVDQAQGSKFLWEIVGELSEEQKVKLLDLFYEKDKKMAILFVHSVLMDYMTFLEHELIRIMEREARKHSR